MGPGERIQCAELELCKERVSASGAQQPARSHALAQGHSFGIAAPREGLRSPAGCAPFCWVSIRRRHILALVRRWRMCDLWHITLRSKAR